MTEHRKGETSQSTVRVPDDLLTAACQSFAARFGLPENTAHPDDLMQKILGWVAERPAQWRCDKCEKAITSAADGGMQWRFDHATGAVDCVEIVHDSCARITEAPSRPMLRVVGAADSNPSEDNGTKAWTVLPLAHLTDDDGLVQLLDYMIAERLPRDKMLPILQRLHVRDFDNATPYIAKALQEERFKHNLSEGLYWQGDLQEALRAAPAAPVKTIDAKVDIASGPRTLSGHIQASKVADADALADIVQTLATAGARLAHLIARVPLDAQGLHIADADEPERLSKRLDRIAHSLFAEGLAQCEAVAAVLSEEQEEPVLYPGHEPAPFLVALDPLDGSDNADFGATTGAIFAILPRRRVGIPTNDEFLLPASDLVVSGYMIFGQPIQLVIELAGSVSIFVYDADEECFILCGSDHKMPDRCATLSVNDANRSFWSDDITAAVTSIYQLNAGNDRQFVSRFSGAMVADIHRILLTGGVFAVPGDSRRPDGKLRQIYECNPISRIVQAAGGMACADTSGFEDLHPKHLHAKSPFFAGTPALIGYFRQGGNQTV